jgi:hypothetical protein
MPERAFRAARDAGFDNVNLDLIYGWPGQTRADWLHDLSTVLSWEPEHLSLYALTIEPGTPYERGVQRGVLRPPDDDAVAELLAHYRIANCQSDAADWPRWDAVTTDVVYVRLHGRVLTYESRYDARALRRWADRIERWRGERRTVYVYFDNTDSGHAWRDALRLRALLSR